MAPPKHPSLLGQNRQSTKDVGLRKGVTTRSQNNILTNVLLKHSNFNKNIRPKRKAEASPQKDKTTKRSALGNITNALGKTLGGHNQISKKPLALGKLQVENQDVTEKIVTKVSAVPTKTKLLPRISKPAIKKGDEKIELSKIVVNNKRSLDLEKSEDSSLYISALEDVTESAKKTRRSITQKNDENKKPTIETHVKYEKSILVKKPIVLATPIPEIKLPPGVQWDFDAENWLDPYQVSCYASDIFKYLKDRERLFPVGNYMEKQVCLSTWMRSLLVDWMVEVQESFELNHETLYLAVKLVDLYLTKVTVGKETLQLLGAASLFIASKFDERIPPMVEDFLYICDGAYAQRELLRMEMNILRVIDFDLGIPLSYRFLRRYARCAKVSMPTLTLARYILEYSLMDYTLISISDSKMAAAALLLALLMKNLGGWTPTLEYYSGYKVHEIKDISVLLNKGLISRHKEALTNVQNKYSHKIFFEVAKLPLKETLEF